MDATIQKLMAEAAILLKSCEIDAALTIYERILERDKNNIEVRQAHIKLLIENVRTEEAISSLAKLVDLIPTDATAHWSLARQLCRNGKHEDAVASYSKAIELLPDRGLYYFQRAESLKAIGRNSDALSDLQAAIELAPNISKYRDGFLRLATELSEWQIVIRVIREQISKGADDFSMRLQLIDALKGEGLVGEALEETRTLMSLSPSKRKVAVHIGPPKTGTTWFQSLLMHNKCQLKEKSIGIILREEANDFITSFQQRFSEKTDLQYSPGQLFVRAPATRDIIISEENLAGKLNSESPTATVMYGDSNQWVSAVSEDFKGAQLQFYMTIRSYAEIFDSGYMQLLKMGSDYSAEAESFRKNLNPHNLSWVPMVSLLLEAIGNAKLTVFEYDNTVNKRLIDAIEKFLGRLDLEKPKMQKRNQRYSDISLKIAQLGNSILDREGQHKLRKLLEVHVINDPNYSFSLFSPEEAAKLDERYKADVARIKSMAGPQLTFSEAVSVSKLERPI